VTARRTGPRVRVGTCGFAEAQGRTFRDLGALEVQRTFYRPPRVATAARWREQAPPGFRFSAKAWQLVTHEATSPTYRRLRQDLSDAALGRAGGFRWNDVTRRAWERTLEVAAALDAGVVLFQTPRSFRPTRRNLDRLETFFSRAERDGRRMAFEPRGEAWSDALLRPLLRDLDLVHAVDPFLRRPVGRGLRYFRLHGIPAYRYRHRYTDAELDRLVSWIGSSWPYRVLFDNDAMAADARRLLRRLRRAGVDV